MAGTIDPTGDALKACQTCGADCRVEVFPASGALEAAATLWVCANNPQFGGDCQHRTAYLTAEAWNSQKKRTPTTEAGVLLEEVVKALEWYAGASDYDLADDGGGHARAILTRIKEGKP